jgi:hypothetical protein
MTITLSIFFLSILGAAALIIRRIPEAQRMEPEEIAGIVQQKKPLVTGMWDAIAHGFQNIWFRYLRRHTLTGMVKMFSRLRIVALRIEQSLFRATSRVRHRTHAPPPEPSAYWKEMHGWRKTAHWHKKKRGE